MTSCINIGVFCVLLINGVIGRFLPREIFRNTLNDTANFEQREDCNCNLRFHQHYETKGCQVAQTDSCGCPTNYLCSSAKHSDSQSKVCLYQGVEYKVGEKITLADTCQVCRCVDGITPQVVCRHRECPQLDPVEGENCHLIYEENKCCPSRYECIGYASENTAEPPAVTCVYINHTYPMGSKIYPPGDPCLVCDCKEDWNGIDNSSCYIQECVFERKKNLLDAGCIPIYHERRCCPIQYYCPEDLHYNNMAVRELAPENSTETGGSCIFGENSYEIGTELSLNNSCVRCTCQVPPDFTCVHQACPLPPRNENCQRFQTQRSTGQCCPTYDCVAEAITATDSSETDAVDSKTSDSETVDNETSDTEAVDSETSDSETVDNETSDTEAVDSETFDTAAVDSETSDTAAVDSETSKTDVGDSEASETKAGYSEISETEAGDSGTLEIEAIDRETSETEAGNSETSTIEAITNGNFETEIVDSEIFVTEAEGSESSKIVEGDSEPSETEAIDSETFTTEVGASETSETEADDTETSTIEGACPTPLCADDSCQILIPPGHECPTCVCTESREKNDFEPVESPMEQYDMENSNGTPSTQEGNQTFSTADDSENELLSQIFFEKQTAQNSNFEKLDDIEPETELQTEESTFPESEEYFIQFRNRDTEDAESHLSPNELRQKRSENMQTGEMQVQQQWNVLQQDGDEMETGETVYSEREFSDESNEGFDEIKAFGSKRNIKPTAVTVALEEDDFNNAIWTTMVPGCPTPLCADSSCRIGIPQGHKCPTCICKKKRQP